MQQQNRRLETRGVKAGSDVLTPEKTEELLSSHQKSMGRIEAKAAEEVQRLEQLLKEMQD